MEFEDFDDEQNEFIESAKLSELLEMPPKMRKQDLRHDLLSAKSVKVDDKKARSKFRLAKKKLAEKL